MDCPEFVQFARFCDQGEGEGLKGSDDGNHFLLGEGSYILP